MIDHVAVALAGHVATDAPILRIDGTQSRLNSAPVARSACLNVDGIVVTGVLVRIVAGDAAERFSALDEALRTNQRQGLIRDQQVLS